MNSVANMAHPPMPANSTPSITARTLKIIHYIEDGLLATLLLTMLFLASSQILLRNLLDIGLVWADPLLRNMVLWLGLLGALAASRDNKHITIDILSRLMSARARQLTHIFTSLFTAIVAGLIAYHGARFIVMELESSSIALAGVPAWLFEIIIPVSFALIALRYLIHFAQHIRNVLTKEDSA